MTHPMHPQKHLTAENAAVGQRIRAARKRKGIALRELNADLGFPASRLNRIERGRYAIRVVDLQRIASRLSVSAAFLLTGEGGVPAETVDERDVIARYRRTDEVGRREIRRLARILTPTTGCPSPIAEAPSC